MRFPDNVLPAGHYYDTSYMDEDLDDDEEYEHNISYYPDEDEIDDDEYYNC